LATMREVCAKVCVNWCVCHRHYMDLCLGPSVSRQVKEGRMAALLKEVRVHDTACMRRPLTRNHAIGPCMLFACLKRTRPINLSRRTHTHTHTPHAPPHVAPGGPAGSCVGACGGPAGGGHGGAGPVWGREEAAIHLLRHGGQAQPPLPRRCVPAWGGGQRGERRW
jgi:hypothetical protein